MVHAALSRHDAPVITPYIIAHLAISGLVPNAGEASFPRTH
jgi:hypothetical protein